MSLVFPICKAMENYLIPLNEEISGSLVQILPHAKIETKVCSIMKYLRDLVKRVLKVDKYGRPYKLKPRAANARERLKKKEKGLLL